MLMRTPAATPTLPWGQLYDMNRLFGGIGKVYQAHGAWFALLCRIYAESQEYHYYHNLKTILSYKWH
jgi:hypothetical protein